MEDRLIHRLQGILEFVGLAKGKLNLHRVCDTFLVGWLVASAVMLVIGLGYVIAGYAVPKFWYGVVYGIAIVVMGGVVFFRRINSDQAAMFCDQFFDLKDSLVSSLNFAKEGKEGEFYELQSDRSRKVIKDLSVARVKYDLPKRIVGAGFLLGVGAVLLAFKGPSQRVLEMRQVHEATEQGTKEIKEELDDLVKEFEKGLVDQDERKMLKPDEVHKWVQELSVTKDQEEAMRQYALLERKLNRLSFSLENRKDEQLLKRAGKELEKTRESKDLGKMLQSKQYKKAAEALQASQKKLAQQKKLAEKKRQLMKMKAISQHMASVAKQSSKEEHMNLKELKMGSKSKDGKGANSGGKLQKILIEMEKSMENLDKALSEGMQNGDKENGRMTKAQEGSIGESQKGAGQSVGKLSQRLESLSKANKAKQRLSDLRAALSMAQGKLGKMAQGVGKSQSDMVGQSNQEGEKAGEGSGDSSRDSQATEGKTGLASQLKGIKGKGPALSSVEAASSGSGVATRASQKVVRDFKHQVESFVEREDVPEEVREGVKNYFENIHQAQ